MKQFIKKSTWLFALAIALIIIGLFVIQGFTDNRATAPKVLSNMGYVG